MAIDSEKLFSRLDKMGVKVVEERLAQGVFGSNKVQLVELWLSRQKSQAIDGIKPQETITSSEPTGIYHRVKRHASVIGVLLMTLAVIAGFSGPIHSWFSDATESTDGAAELSEPISELSTAEQLHRSDVARYPTAASFLFGEYKRAEGMRRGQFTVYSATRENFVEIDRLACSYPDATKIRRDFDQQYLAISCSYPSYFAEKEERDNSSSAVVRAWFFKSDAIPSLVLKCDDCRELIITELSMMPTVKQVYVTVLTDAKDLTPSGRNDLKVDMSPLPENPAESISRRFIVQFSDDWSLFAVIPRWKPHEVPMNSR